MLLVDNIIAIDGCQVGCDKAILENNGIENKNYLVLTDPDKVKTKIKALLA